jgi:mRNA-degrading endonuclease RelE of RelBE toxin-antitoxin system
MVIAIEDLESLQMTREILATPGAPQDIRQGAKDIEEGRYHSLADVRAALEARRRDEDDDSWRVSEPLHDELDGFRGARRGEYRVVLSADQERRNVDVVRIDHRADVYR